MYWSACCGELDPLDVQLLADQGGVIGEPLLVRRIGQDDFHQPQRLADLELRPHPGIAAQRDDLAHQGHFRGELLVDRARVRDRIVAEVDALGRG